MACHTSRTRPSRICDGISPSVANIHAAATSASSSSMALLWLPSSRPWPSLSNRARPTEVRAGREGRKEGGVPSSGWTVAEPGKDDRGQRDRDRDAESDNDRLGLVWLGLARLFALLPLGWLAGWLGLGLGLGHQPASKSEVKCVGSGPRNVSGSEDGLSGFCRARGRRRPEQERQQTRRETRRTGDRLVDFEGGRERERERGGGERRRCWLVVGFESEEDEEEQEDRGRGQWKKEKLPTSERYDEGEVSTIEEGREGRGMVVEGAREM
ncbi:hypothetical protein AXG93_4368s1140 [Marchantia polymorpha subsp. ruderalis]|uniref:Uncharacterized protein n=1 Tax=Marchantia polymorpha subsp. ruderalis TaxID=1480154 RepID=A0A176VZM7_MARPO|nr:hypothetical protein AXG93_4368s1140 [Marchantia polymorpha subsp. ruderalis]